MIRIVALHGFLGQLNDFSALKEALLSLRPKIAFQEVDILLTSVSKSLQGWARTFNETQIRDERNILLGYSMGGRLALHAAFDKPGLWDDTVLISTHPGLISEVEKSERLKSDRDWAEKLMNLPWQEVMAQWNAQPVFSDSENLSRAGHESKKNKWSEIILNWSLAKQEFSEEKLVSLRHKTHWYAGEKDVKFTELFRHLKAEGFIENEAIIKGAGHRIVFDKPRDLADQLVHDLKL